MRCRCCNGSGRSSRRSATRSTRPRPPDTPAAPNWPRATRKPLGRGSSTRWPRPAGPVTGPARSRGWSIWPWPRSGWGIGRRPGRGWRRRSGSWTSCAPGSSIRSFGRRSRPPATGHRARELLVELLMPEHLAAGGTGHGVSAAFAAVDRARARTLVEMLAAAEAVPAPEAPPGLLDERARLLERLSVKAGRLWEGSLPGTEEGGARGPAPPARPRRGGAPRRQPGVCPPDRPPTAGHPRGPGEPRPGDPAPAVPAGGGAQLPVGDHRRVRLRLRAAPAAVARGGRDRRPPPPGRARTGRPGPRHRGGGGPRPHPARPGGRAAARPAAGGGGGRSPARSALRGAAHPGAPGAGGAPAMPVVEAREVVSLPSASLLPHQRPRAGGGSPGPGGGWRSWAIRSSAATIRGSARRSGPVRCRRPAAADPQARAGCR